jgi:hypothetical protein
VLVITISAFRPSKIHSFVKHLLVNIFRCFVKFELLRQRTIRVYEPSPRLAHAALSFVRPFANSIYLDWEVLAQSQWWQLKLINPTLYRYHFQVSPYPFTCTIYNIPTKFSSGGLHEKHVVATWNFGNHLNICY